MSLISQEREVFTEDLKSKKDQYIRNRVYYESLPTLNPPEFYKSHKINHFWVKLDNCFEELDQWNKAEFVVLINQQPQLEVVGSKCDHRYEKKLDFISKKKQKVAVIQRGWRGYRGRKKAWERR